MLFDTPSLVSLLMEAVGALLIGTHCLVLSNTLRRKPLIYWAAGWFSLFGALTALLLGFTIPAITSIAQPLYLFGEYVFGYLLIVGCRYYITTHGPDRREAWLAIPAGLLAIFLPRVSGGDFNVFFAVHTLVYAYLFLLAFRVLWRASPNPGNVVGMRVMKIALLLLTIDYTHYAPLFAAAARGILPHTLPYLVYSSLYDLIFLVMLAFGMVMATTGDVQHELEVVNARLAQTRDRLEAMVQLDHLTSALNRHAFYSIIGDSRAGSRVVFSGCAAVADIDNLKQINDRHGHAAGDGVIRAVASAIRACIRADDLLFRWGGDEFLVLLIGVSEADARAHLDGVNESLQRVAVRGVAEPVDVSVSLGYAPFDSAGSLEEVIALADTAMYGRKRTDTSA
jgi:diguanylate cyclase (GGDEF)-like protein